MDLEYLILLFSVLFRWNQTPRKSNMCHFTQREQNVDESKLIINKKMEMSPVIKISILKYASLLLAITISSTLEKM